MEAADTARRDGAAPASLSTAAARNLATTTKSPPMMRGVTPRWLLEMLPWVEVTAGVFRVNRRRTLDVADAPVAFTSVGASVRVIPRSLRGLAALRGLDDDATLEELADRFVQREVAPGEEIVARGDRAGAVVLVARGKVERVGRGPYGDEVALGVLADGDHASLALAGGADAGWPFAARAMTACTVLTLDRAALDAVARDSEPLRAHLDAVARDAGRPRDKDGQAAIALAAGHAGEPALPRAFVDYEARPREYELSVAQTILRVHTRVADLYNGPMNQLEEQLRLTLEALRETQERELVNNPEFGLLANADPRQRIATRAGPPTPDDLDELLSRRRKPRFFLAHPRAIAAFGRECSRRGVYPETVTVRDVAAPAWRGVPLLPCDKIPVAEGGTTSIMLLRTGLDEQGVVGLHQTGIPDEVAPSCNVRFMGIDEHAVMSYLVSAYYSAAILIPDALGVLDRVQLGR